MRIWRSEGIFGDGGSGRCACGLAVLQVLEGKLPKGLLAPYTPEICDPLREELKGLGIEMTERIVA